VWKGIEFTTFEDSPVRDERKDEENCSEEPNDGVRNALLGNQVKNDEVDRNVALMGEIIPRIQNVGLKAEGSA
jgi:hypothetical protein